MHALLIRSAVGVGPDQVLLESCFETVDWRTTLSVSDLVEGYDAIILHEASIGPSPAIEMVKDTQINLLIFNASPITIEASPSLGGESAVVMASEHNLSIALPRFLFFLKHERNTND